MKAAGKFSVGEGYFVQYYEPKFGTYSIKDEHLHESDFHERPHYSLTETQYYAFFVPDKNISCFTWLWYHPNLKTLLAGTMAWQGIKRFNLGCELFDFRNYLSGDVFDKSFTDYTLDNGLQVKMTDPGKKFHLRYDDPERGNNFDVVQTAVSEPIMWPSSRHFEQVMRCEGVLTLRGEKHDISCFSVRDRTFNECRLETPMAIPPNSWIYGVFDEEFSFCLVGMEHPDERPMWSEKFDVPAAASLRFGWLIVDGEKVAIREARTKVDYDRTDLMPRSISMTLTDTGGRQFEIVGTVGAATPFRAWLNVRNPTCMVHWRCKGRTGIGELQMTQFSDFLYTYS